jgi:hypothetical protein
VLVAATLAVAMLQQQPAGSMLELTDLKSMVVAQE